tara:strand:+ start:356 stop:1264 length:909 start_codon:yes stop_codon:yes gene_type:complete
MGIFDSLFGGEKEKKTREKETKYYPDGKIKEINDGKTCKIFYESGSLKEEYWNEDGTSSLDWDANVQSRICYYENGKIKEIITKSPTGMHYWGNSEANGGTNGGIEQKFDENGLMTSISLSDYSFDFDKENRIVKNSNNIPKAEIGLKLVIIKSEYLSFFDEDLDKNNPLVEIEYSIGHQEFDDWDNEWYNVEDFKDRFFRFYINSENNYVGTDFSNVDMEGIEQEDTYEVDELEFLLQQDIKEYGDSLKNLLDIREIKDLVNRKLKEFNLMNSNKQEEENYNLVYEDLKRFLKKPTTIKEG